MSPTTLFLGKLIGLYLVIVALAMMARRKATIDALDGMMRNPSLLLFIDIVALAAGLALVIGHHVWSGGALPVIVTIVGWVVLLKALALLFVPQDQMIRLYEALNYKKYFFAYMSATLVLGLYLTIAAFGG